MSWPLPSELSDSELESRLFGAGRSVLSRPLPDFAKLAKELKKRGVTRQLLWEEYRREHPRGYGYSQFCEHFKRYLEQLSPALRQEHKAGEKLFVDWAGQTIGYREKGERKQASLFVGVLGASNYTFADVFRDQKIDSWCQAHAANFEFIGGVPSAIVPDNPKTAVTRPCRYDPDLNPTYKDLAAHYNTAILPARVRHPQDKAKVEAGVGFAETQILAALRNREFHSFGELKAAVREKLRELNERPFKKLPGNRCDAFEQLDKPALKPLPSTPFELGIWQQAKVWGDYHIQVQKHFYSVPHEHLGKKVDVRVTERTVEVFFDGKRIAVHQKSHEAGGFSTLASHRPDGHNAIIQRSAESYLRKGQLTGPNTLAIIRHTLDHFPHPEMGFRSCEGILRLKRDYGVDRLEAACAKALERNLSGFRVINNILKNNREHQEPAAAPAVRHANVRGSQYYSE
jgi:transposase